MSDAGAVLDQFLCVEEKVLRITAAVSGEAAVPFQQIKSRKIYPDSSDK